MSSIERVYKYPMTLGDWASVQMPEGAVPLKVEVQQGELMLWARVKIGNPPMTHHFRIAGTGHDLSSDVGRHIGTIFLGSLVFHVFSRA